MNFYLSKTGFFFINKLCDLICSHLDLHYYSLTKKKKSYNEKLDLYLEKKNVCCVFVELKFCCSSTNCVCLLFLT